MSHHDTAVPENDRRNSPRIPLNGPVRMGPPKGDPFAVVSASDLSMHGVFIDADRPVKVGARFSAEIAIGDDVVYIPEAEVAYNRERENGSGFGARFIDPPSDALARIEAEIARLHPPMSKIVADVVEPKLEPKLEPKSPPSLPPVSEVEILAEKSTDNFDPDGATEVPAKRFDLGMKLDVSLPPISAEEDAHEEDEGVKETIMRAGRAVRHQFVERARRYPPVWTGVAAIGLMTVLSAVGLALWMGSSAEAVEVVPNQSRGITANTQQALMGEQKLPEIVEVAPAAPAKAEAKVEPKKPLPPLVFVDETSPTVVKKVEEPKHAEPVVQAPKKTEAKKPAPEAKKTKIADLKPAAPATKTAGRAKLELGVANGARVLRTHVLKSPDRFVIDLGGTTEAPSVPATGGAVKAVRVGKHPDHVRIVIETSGPIDRGQVSKNGRDLSVTLDLLR